MKRFPVILLITVLFSIFNSCCTEEPWQALFNGENLDNWDKHLGTPLTGLDSLAQLATPESVFSVVEEDSVRIIRISGEINASLATREEFENYHLLVELKWGDEVFTRRNSGLLYHSYGDFGEGLGVWMSSHELQLLTGSMGDSYRMGKSHCEIPMTKNSEGRFVYTKGAEKMPSIPDTETKIVAKDGNYEKAVGEWNTIELYCFGRTSVHVVNGNVNMINYNSGKYLGEGNIEPNGKGKIQFQSEGGEMFIRSIKIKPIKEIPAELLK